MSRTTLADAKNSRIPAILNVSPSDDRFLQYLNDAQERLVKSVDFFWGSHQRVQFCVTSGCLVLPRQIANVESVAICDRPIVIRNRFFEWLETGVGLRNENHSSGDGRCGGGCGDNQLLDRGNVATFSDIIPSGKKVKVYADIAEDSDAEILLQGTDDNGQWIITETTPGSGIWQDGEKVSINAATPQLSTKYYSSLVSAQKPVTNGNVRLYEYNVALATQRSIAIYEPDETNPTYRKMFVSALEGTACCSCTGDDSETVQVTVMAKLEFIPARRDSDWLLIGNLGALKLACMSLMKEENNLIGEADAYFNGGQLQDGTRTTGAKGILRGELRHYTGRGLVVPMRMQPRNLAGAGVRTLI